MGKGCRWKQAGQAWDLGPGTWDLGPEGQCEVWAVKQEVISANGQEGLTQRVLRCSGVRCLGFSLSTVSLMSVGDEFCGPLEVFLYVSWRRG